MVSTSSQSEPIIYEGQFGEFTITDRDRQDVKIYRGGLFVAAVAFALGSFLLLFWGPTPLVLASLTPLFALFSCGLAVSLLKIHIYLVPLHRLLQLFLLVGTIAALVLAGQGNEPLALFVYRHPLSILGIGFTFAALTGIYFKEAFCFNRLETKVLTPLVPLLLLGHLFGFLPLATKQIFMGVWGVLFLVFALRKVIQPIPPDIGDKSVFAYLKEQKKRTPQTTSG
ncbi:DUF2301 domain-containing membrane protein [Lusitaniella coriacea]|uniref:DUF2301 domain-containing membrane protein n=1 Tax=Lusitaniella coriacea TaxID=1983105 RepID=UPI003CECF611